MGFRFYHRLVWLGCLVVVVLSPTITMGFSLTIDIGKLSHFQIGEIWLKISIEMEEDFERKVKPGNDEGLEEVYMI